MSRGMKKVENHCFRGTVYVGRVT